MSLRSTDITKVRKLSLKEIKLPAPERKAEPVSLPPGESPPTQEELLYSRLVAKNPLLEKLVERLDLVSCTTGERIRKVALRDNLPEPEPDKPKLIALAQRIIESGNSYTQEELIGRIVEATQVSRDRAERGFTLLLQAGAIESTQGERYYLTGATPF